MFKQRCVTQQLLAAAIVSSAALVVGKGGLGSGTMIIGVVGSGWRHAFDQLSARDLPNMHSACCVLLMTQIDAKACLLPSPQADIQRRQRSQTLRRRTSTDATCRTCVAVRHGTAMEIFRL